MKLLLISGVVVCGATSCGRTPASAQKCEVAGGWELGSHDPTDRSTNMYVTERGPGALDVERDVRRADGTHGWVVEHGRRLDDRHLEFDLASSKERCEVGTSCDQITCTSFVLVRHFCDVAGDWHATFARHTGTAHITNHRDDLEIELAGRQVKGRRLSARDAIVQLPEGDVRCDISESCNHIGCSTRKAPPASNFLFELNR